MGSIEILRAEWSKSARLRPMHRVMTITEDGLMLGAGTVLTKMDRAAEPTTGLVLGAAAEERLLALLAAGYGRPVEGRVLGNIRRASQYWRDGQWHLAAIELALTGLPPLADEPGASYRLYLADRLIDSGFAPRKVAKALGVGLALPDTARAGFNPNQPRVPAGNPDGGQWDNGNGVTAAPAAARNPPATPEYRTGDPDKFFDTLYPPVHALAQRFGIDETWLLGLSAYESGWLDRHNRELNDPFGVTHGGGPNVAYGSIADAVAYWEQRCGPVVRGATSPEDFTQRLWE
ncbi:MAG TPA: hypothetical protein VMS01_01385, partial [Stellaceae bacterium]|nr:hypothetical protein [Stellaceae bacterium]